MTDTAKILRGSYKGVPITIDGGSVSGGRKVSIKQFPGRDTQLVEDIGQKPRSWSLDIVINDKPGKDYFDYRDELLSVLDRKGSGILIHPLYGRIEGVVATSYSLNETFTEFGYATVSVQFEVDNNPGIPQRSSNTVSEVLSANDKTRSAAKADISARVKVTPTLTGNLGAMADKIAKFAERARDATVRRGEFIEGLDEYADAVRKLNQDAVYLATQPEILAAQFDQLMARINTLYGQAKTRFDAFRDLFGFGDDDGNGSIVTAGQIEKHTNNSVFNGAVGTIALGYAYINSTQIAYQTTAEIDEIQALLDAQYAAVIENGSSQDVKDAITDLRVTALLALDTIRLQTDEIITVETPPTTCRLLSFAYYGSDEDGETIANLNRIDDVSFVSGNVEILTNATQG